MMINYEVEYPKLEQRVEQLESDNRELRLKLFAFKAYDEDEIMRMRDRGFMGISDMLRYIRYQQEEIKAHAKTIHELTAGHDSAIARSSEYVIVIGNLRTALTTVLASAHPNQNEHPVMYAAWEHAQKVMAAPSTEKTEANG